VGTEAVFYGSQSPRVKYISDGPAFPIRGSLWYDFAGNSSTRARSHSSV